MSFFPCIICKNRRRILHICNFPCADYTIPFPIEWSLIRSCGDHFLRNVLWRWIVIVKNFYPLMTYSYNVFQQQKLTYDPEKVWVAIRFDPIHAFLVECCTWTCTPTCGSGKHRPQRQCTLEPIDCNLHIIFQHINVGLVNWDGRICTLKYLKCYATQPFRFPWPRQTPPDCDFSAGLGVGCNLAYLGEQTLKLKRKRQPLWVNIWTHPCINFDWNNDLIILIHFSVGGICRASKIITSDLEETPYGWNPQSKKCIK